MSNFQFSQRSMDKLVGVYPDLIYLAQKALYVSKIDFGIIQGLRTREEQLKNIKSGASQTMNSKHLTGHAIDIAAYVNGALTWELSFYCEIADAFKQAAVELDIGKVRWGGAWTVPDIREWNGSMKEAMDSYVKLRKKQGQRPFLDAGHFELNV